jgi:hypothetical protein
VFGSCGFLSFSLVFCLLGGRLETTLYIHFIRRRVEARRHSSALRKKNEKRKEREKAEKNAILRSWALRGRIVNRPVQLTVSASPGPAPSGGGRVRLDGGPPRLCARSLSPPPLRLSRRAYAGREAEKPNAPMPTQILGRRLHQSVHKRGRVGRAEAASVRHAVAVLKWTPVYIAGDGCSSSSGLTLCRT